MCCSLFLIKLQVLGLQLETPTQVFSCRIYEIFKNTHSEEHLRKAASAVRDFFHGKTKSLKIKKR